MVVGSESGKVSGFMQHTCGFRAWHISHMDPLTQNKYQLKTTKSVDVLIISMKFQARASSI